MDKFRKAGLIATGVFTGLIITALVFLSPGIVEAIGQVVTSSAGYWGMPDSDGDTSWFILTLIWVIFTFFGVFVLLLWDDSSY